jgi:ABC-2 type transport system permease protein
MSSLAAAVSASPAPNLVRCYFIEARHEFLRLLRTPMFCIPTLVFPASFYLMFALALGRGATAGGAEQSLVLLASYGVFGVMAPGLFGFGVSVAVDRDRGWLRLRQALPMPPGSYLVAKLAMAMLFAAIIAAILATIAITLTGVRLPLSAWALLFAVEVFGVLPFGAIGLWIGSLINAQAAPAVVNLVYLPMAFLSGLWLPLSMLPAILRDMAPIWPAWHLAQLAQGAIGNASTGSPLVHVAVLAAVTLGFLALARRRLARG